MAASYHWPMFRQENRTLSQLSTHQCDKQVVENEIDCYYRVEPVGFPHCDLHNFGPALIRKDLKHRHEGLGKEKFNLLKHDKWSMFSISTQLHFLKQLGVYKEIFT